MKQRSVLKIALQKSKGEPSKYVNKINLIEHLGIDPNFHDNNDDGLIVIVSLLLVDWIGITDTKGLCFNRFKYNICVEESIADFEVGDIIKLGDCLVEISDKEKKCFFNECDRSKIAEPCLLRSEVKFAKVVKGGIIFAKNI